MLLAFLIEVGINLLASNLLAIDASASSKAIVMNLITVWSSLSFPSKLHARRWSIGRARKSSRGAFVVQNVLSTSYPISYYSPENEMLLQRSTFLLTYHCA